MACRESFIITKELTDDIYDSIFKRVDLEREFGWGLEYRDAFYVFARTVIEHLGEAPIMTMFVEANISAETFSRRMVNKISNRYNDFYRHHLVKMPKPNRNIDVMSKGLGIVYSRFLKADGYSKLRDAVVIGGAL